MIFSEKWGKDVKTATDLALQELNVSIDEVKVTILEEPTKGFLGIGSKLALVRVEVIENDKADKQESEKEAVSLKEYSKIDNIETVVKEDKISTAEGDLEKNDEDVEKALAFLNETTAKMGVSLEFKVSGKKNDIHIDISGKDSGSIIGKRGQTLDAIQYLTSLVVNKNKENYVRVVLDAENYRKKREKTLERLALKLADKVVRTKRSVKLEPMNPYERMVIHSALQKNPKVLTRSEGEDPYRRIIIELK